MRNPLQFIFRAPEQKSSRTAQLVAFEGGGRARWTPRDYAALSREGYVKNAIVHRAVRLVAEGVGASSFVLYDGAAEHDTHPLLDLIARPNPRQDGASFLEALTAHLLLAGNAYIEAVALDEPGGRQVRELYALRPDRMRVVPGPDGWPEAYDYQVAGKSVRFAQDGAVPPILHLTFFNPLDDHYGLSPLEAAAVAVDTHNAAAKWNKALLDNAARYAVNSGTGRSGKILRRLLGLSDATSVVSDVVISAVQAKDARRFIETICDERLRFLQSLKTWPVFGKGWGRRIAEVRSGALAMAAGAAAPSAAVTPATGRGEVPVNRKAQGGTVAVVVAAGGSAAQQAQQNGTPLPWIVAVLIATGVIAVAAWGFWRWRQKHFQEN